MPSSSTIISQAALEHDHIIAHHFHQLWLDNEVREELILDDWLDITLKFIQKARQELKFQAFIAQVEAEIVGSVSCQLFAGLYPSPFKPEHRHYGYIWNVYVQTDYRRQGIATQLKKTEIA
ncbi:MAG: GNAT family N-acetyltransferase [Waterburya sp.]